MTKLNSVAVLGTGAFGVALVKLVAPVARTVQFWGRDEAVCESINKRRHHPSRLPQVALANNVTALTDLSVALTNADWVILALPMEALSSVLVQAQPFFSENTVIVSTAKGIDVDTLSLPCDIIANTVSKTHAQRACYLSGPSFAIELAMDLPTALTVASFDQASAIAVQNGLSNAHCRLYRSDDVIGVCVGGAFKNVIAIAAGACTGLGLGRNALAALITRGLREVARLAKCLHGNPLTLSGLSGAGDLILSCTDDMSRNHRLGTLLADGMKLDDALTLIGSVVEGARTAKAIPHLEKKYGIDLPISRAVHQVLYEGLAAKVAISTLLERSLKEESL